MHVTPLYAAVLALVFIALSVRTLLMRRHLRVAVGDGGDARLLRAMRVHANFAEYVPLCLIVIFLLESQRAPALLLHSLGICLLAGRLSHAFGVSQATENFRYRVFGMAMTFTVLGVASALLLYGYASRVAS